MRRNTKVRTALLVAGVATSVCVASATATALSLGSTSLLTAKTTAAGKPVATNVLLCGTWVSGTDRSSGASSIDHPSGSSAMGNEYPYTGQSCDNPGNASGMFTWTIGHSNVNTVSERGTEHGVAMLSSDANKAAGFNGHITDFDLQSGGDPYPCGNWQVYYSSGHNYSSCAPASGPGNYNTHGGAATGDHLRGTYGTVVYQDSNNSNCQTGSQSYCFEAILEGQTN